MAAAHYHGGDDTVMRNQTLKRLWGLAKQQGLSKDDIYTIVYRETGKEHMTDCTDRQLERVVKAIIAIKDINAQRPGMATKKQLWKIHELEKELGWADNPKRLQAFVAKYYHVQSIEWLRFEQAIKLIDSLKNVAEKESRKGNANADRGDAAEKLC